MPHISLTTDRHPMSSHSLFLPFQPVMSHCHPQTSIFIILYPSYFGTKPRFPFKLHFQFQDLLCSWHSPTIYYETKTPFNNFRFIGREKKMMRENLTHFPQQSCEPPSPVLGREIGTGKWTLKKQGIPKDVSVWFCNSSFTRMTPTVISAIRSFWRQSFHWQDRIQR